MRYVKRLLLAYLILKPYYLFSSGGLQLADLFLLGAFVLYLTLSKFNTEIKKNIIEVVRANTLFILFIVMTFVINSVYFAYYGHFKFILSSLYFVFAFVAILMFSIYCRSKKFLLSMSKVFKFNLLVQVALYFLHVGRFYSPDRYMGTFNDPNQFAFFALISFLFMYVINILIDTEDSLTLYLILTTGLIYLSASTGMLLGLGVFLFLQIIYGILKLEIRYTTVRNVFYALASSTLLVIVVLLVLPAKGSNSKKFSFTQEFNNVSIAQRIKEKTAKAEGASEFTIWEERGYDKIYKYPQMTIYGAGEGNYERYKQAATVNELHATFPSMLFYYGIVPLIILFRWIYLKVRYYDPKIIFALAALFAESFTLLNQRQSLFWILIILGGIYTHTIDSKETTNKIPTPKLKTGGNNA